MIYKSVILLFSLVLFEGIASAQNTINYFLEKGIENSPSLKEYENLYKINSYQAELNEAQNNGYNVYISADYLFSPYFNNNGKLISANPSPEAVGYDAGITNGGLYSAQLNIEKNIFNGGILNSLNTQNKIQESKYKFSYQLGKHDLIKQITDQYLFVYQSLLQYNLSKKITSNLETQLNIITNLVEKGYEKTQNYLLMNVELQKQKNNSKEALQKYRNDLTDLYTLCGIQDTQRVLVEKPELKIKSRVYDSYFNENYRLDSLSISSQQDVFESKYDPQLKVFFNTGFNAVELEGFQRKFGLSAGLNFLLPLFDGGQKNITRQQSVIEKKSINSYKSYSMININNHIENSLLNIKTIEENIRSLEKQLEDYKKVLEIVKEQVKTGEISTIDYLTVLRAYIDLEKMKIEKDTDYLKEINNYNYWNW